MKNINNTSRVDDSYVLPALSYLSIFSAPIVLPLFTWILVGEPISIHGKEALTNHVFAWICFFIDRDVFISSRETYDRPFNHQLLISVIFVIITVPFSLIALVLYVFNIIRGVKTLLKK